MLDYEDLESLERYALASGTEERRQLLSGSTAVTPGQAFLAGLFALEQGDMTAANEQLKRLQSLGVSNFYRRLEALLALRSWPTDPAVTCAYVKRTCGFNFHAPPPPPDAAQSGDTAQSQVGSGAHEATSSLDPSLYSGKAFLREALRLARAPSGAAAELGSRPQMSTGAADPTGDVACLLSLAGRVAALVHDKDFNLDLSFEERLNLLGAERGGAGEFPIQALAGSPLLLGAARATLQAKRIGALKFLLPSLTAEQLDSLMAELPPETACTEALLVPAVQKMYGTQGAVAGAAAVVDAAGAAHVTSHSMPYLTPVEAAAIQLRVLDLCDRIRNRLSETKGAQASASPHLTSMEARALLPLTQAAVREAVAAAAAANLGFSASGASDGADDRGFAAAEKVAEAAKFLSRLIRGLSALGLLAAKDLEGPNQKSRPAEALALEDLGPALPRLQRDMRDVVLPLLTAVLGLSPDPPALFAADGALVGALDPAAQVRLLAEVMLTRGPSQPGDAESVDWVAAYRDAGGDLAQLAQSVELELSDPNGEDEGRVAALDDDVALLVTHKGVQHISVLVYDISTESYYREQRGEVNMGIDLEGLGATFQLEIPLPPGLPGIQRCRRLVALPQLNGRRGVWVVEVQGGGRHSRALLRRGSMAAIVRPSPAGLAMTLFYENGARVPEPRVWVDGRMYGVSAATGEVLVPYRTDRTTAVPAILVDGDGGFASLMRLQHMEEEYDLQCGMHFEQESAAAAGRAASAPLLLQLNLTIGGWSAPLELLQDVVLTIEVDDLEGGGDRCSGAGVRRQVFQDWALGDGLRAAVVQVHLPDRPGSVTACLTARIKLVAPGPDGEPAFQDHAERRTWQLNGSNRDSHILRDLHLTRSSDGRYLLRALGRAGEPHPGVPVVVALTHTFSGVAEPPLGALDSAPPAPTGDAAAELASGDSGDVDGSAKAVVVRRTLVTDAGGTIDLGHLAGITAIAAGMDGFSEPQAATTFGHTAVNADAGSRRRYLWRLPCAVSGGVPPDGCATCIAGWAGGEGILQKGLLLRLMAADGDATGDGVQCRIPAAALTKKTREVGGAEVDARPGLGLVLFSLAPSPSPLGRIRNVAQVLDESHVAVGEGCLEILGLGPGVYRLIVTRLNLTATILVYKGPVASPAALAAPSTSESGDNRFVVSGGMVAPLSEAKPLQVVDFRASADGGVTARLLGSPSQLSRAVVHVILTRFEPHLEQPKQANSVKALGAPRLSAGRGTAFGEPRAGEYQNGKRLGDEVRYVLKRRRLVAEGRVRPTPALVDRPSLLVQPWKVRETNTSIQVAEQGERFSIATRGDRCLRSVAPAAAAHYGGPPRSSKSAFGYPAPSCRLSAVLDKKSVGTLGLDFCPPAAVLPNVKLAPDGEVHISPQQLAAAVAAVASPANLRLTASDPWVSAGHRVARIIAYSAPAGVPSEAFGALPYCEARTVVEGAPEPSWSDPRVLTALQRAFPGGSGCVEQRSCHPLQPGSELVVTETASAKVQLYGTVAKVWALYGSLLSLAPHHPATPCGGDAASATWAEFACLSAWPNMSRDSKILRYSQLACRELAFFCYCHDAEFFRTVVLPYLRLRLPSSRCCLDAWLAGVRGKVLVEAWTAPHLYETLTPLERILLAWEEDLLAEGKSGASKALGAPASSAPPPAAVVVLPRLARLAADMRARWRRRVVQAGAAAAADANRRRFEIALNGPGQGEKDLGQAVAPVMEVARLETESSFEDDDAPGGSPLLDGHPPQMFAAPNAMMMPTSGRVAGYSAYMSAMMAERQAAAAAPGYRAAQATHEWAEAGWFRRAPADAAGPDSISPESEFWADLAEHLSRGGRLGSQSSSGAASGAAFLPRRLESAGWTFTDALLATAVVGVPWEESAPRSVTAGTGLTLTAVVPTVAYVQQTAVAAAAEAASAAPNAAQRGSSSSSGVLLLQRLLDPNLDPSDAPKQPREGEDGDEDEEDEGSKLQHNAGGVEVPPGAPLTYGRLYCYAVTISNTGPAAVHLEVTIQAPEGAVALGGRSALWIHTTDVRPYGACQLPLYYFYFPTPEPPSVSTSAVGPNSAVAAAAGRPQFRAFPAVAAQRGKVLAVALGHRSQLQVLPSLPPAPTLDLSCGTVSWSRLAALPPTTEADTARLRYLAEGDVSAANLSLVLWRCRDPSFWKQAVAALRRRRVWDARIWSYAVLHGNEEAMKELLPSLDVLKDVLGPEAPAAGPLLYGRGSTVIDAVSGTASVIDPDRLPHLEYWPSANARAHPLSSKGAILNDAVAESWRQLLRRLAALTAGGLEPSTEDLLAVAYFLVLQDRLVEASSVVERVEARVRAGPLAGPSRSGAACEADADAATAVAAVVAACNQDLQICYLRAWLVLGDPIASAADLQAAAASVRLWRRSDAALEVEEAAAVSCQVLEPKWQARVAAMVEALEEAALIAGAGGGVGRAEASADGAAALAGACGSRVEPALLLYDSPDGPRGSVVLEARGVQKVILNARFMDLELLFSASPFDTTLTSAAHATAAAATAVATADEAAGGLGKFSFLRPSWTKTLDLPAIAAAGGVPEGLAPGAIQLLPEPSELTAGSHYRLLLQSCLLVQAPAEAGAGPGGAASSGAMLLEAVSAGGGGSGSGSGSGGAGNHRAKLVCYSCGFKATILREKGVVLVAGADDGMPVFSAYVKAYVKYDDDANAPGFHKDGYTDRRGLLDFWTLTSKPVAKVRTIALFISHPALGCTLMHTEPPLH